MEPLKMCLLVSSRLLARFPWQDNFSMVSYTIDQRTACITVECLCKNTNDLEKNSEEEFFYFDGKTIAIKLALTGK